MVIFFFLLFLLLFLMVDLLKLSMDNASSSTSFLVPLCHDDQQKGKVLLPKRMICLSAISCLLSSMIAIVATSTISKSSRFATKSLYLYRTYLFISIAKQKNNPSRFFFPVFWCTKYGISLPVGYKSARRKTGYFEWLWRNFSFKFCGKQISQLFSYCELTNSPRIVTKVRRF